MRQRNIYTHHQGTHRIRRLPLEEYDFTRSRNALVVPDPNNLAIYNISSASSFSNKPTAPLAKPTAPSSITAPPKIKPTAPPTKQNHKH